MTFSKGDVWRPPHCEFIGAYTYEQDNLSASPGDEIGRVPDYREIVPANVSHFAIIREEDGFADTPGGDELAYSLGSHGYGYEIVRRRPDGVSQVSEDKFFDDAQELIEEDGYSEEEATEIVAERIGYDPLRTEDTHLVFYWPEP